MLVGVVDDAGEDGGEVNLVGGVGGEGDVAYGVELSGSDPGEGSASGGVLKVVDGESVDSETSLAKGRTMSSLLEGEKKAGDATHHPLRLALLLVRIHRLADSLRLVEGTEAVVVLSGDRLSGLRRTRPRGGPS